MENNKGTIPFETEDGEIVDLYILEDTKINGAHYLLVTDDLEDDEADAFIMKEQMSQEEEEFSTYEFVEDDNEMNAVAKIFSELMDDVDFIS